MVEVQNLSVTKLIISPNFKAKSSIGKCLCTVLQLLSGINCLRASKISNF